MYFCIFTVKENDLRETNDEAWKFLFAYLQDSFKYFVRNLLWCV